ncbi:Uncharacterized protein QTN25_001410 [Entamoeba marina]
MYWVLLLLFVYTLNAQTTGLVAQGIQRVGQGLSLLEQKMQSLETTERNIMMELDNDLEDITRIGLRQDRLKARQKIREEKRSLRKIERTKRKVLVKMYNILRVLSPKEQGRIVRSLNLMNRLHINHLYLLGVEEAELAANNGFAPRPIPDYPHVRMNDVEGNVKDMGDFLMRDKSTDAVELQRKKLKDAEEEMHRLEKKYASNPFLKNQLKKKVQ